MEPRVVDIPAATGPFDFANRFWLRSTNKTGSVREIKMELPQGVDSKFRYILVAAKRAHQLIGGAKARVQSESKKVIVIAQREVSAGLVPFIMHDGKGHDLERAATVKLG
jgi:DNA-directed RNA polymerase subunit omega